MSTHLLMLGKLAKCAPKQSATVPEWLIGCWKREYIFDSDGTMDEYSDGTKVVYMQTPSAYIDFRIPHELAVPSKKLKSIRDQQTVSDPFCGGTHEYFNLLGSQLCDSGMCHVEMLHDLNDQKVADLVHQGHNIIALEKSNAVKDFFTFPVAQWTADINYQLNTTYPEPGILTQHESRTECMYEQPPSNEYLELWQYQRGNDGPCIYLELLKETAIDNKDVIQRQNGRMMIIGDHWMIVRDRKCSAESVGKLIAEFGRDPKGIIYDEKGKDHDLRNVMHKMNDIEFSKQLLDSEYSYGRLVNQRPSQEIESKGIESIGSMEFEIELSSIPCFVGRRVKVFDESRWDIVNGNIIMESDEESKVKRYWELKHFGWNRNHIFKH